MAEQDPQQEPSMEEILASIRRIISEDGEEGEQAEAASEAEAEPVVEAPAEVEPEPEPEPEMVDEDEDVLELTEEIQDDGTVVDLAAGNVVDEPDDEADEDVELEMIDVDDEPEPEAEPDVIEEPADLPEAIVAEAAAAYGDDRLISQPPATDSVSTLAALAAAVDTHRRATDPSIGPKSIEDLVKEVMRPMIREWLDAHLPSLVERLVSREIERLTREAEDISNR